MDNSKIKELITSAENARAKAYAPYSAFTVGAALLCDDGSIYNGVNIENASYPVGICAERAAFSAAVSDGKRNFSAIAIVGGHKDKEAEKPCFPCGICRQFMSELCSRSFYVISAASVENYSLQTLSELLPFAFEL